MLKATGGNRPQKNRPLERNLTLNLGKTYKGELLTWMFIHVLLFLATCHDDTIGSAMSTSHYKSEWEL